MANTPTYGWPYPGPDDGPDGPEQIEALALAIEGTLSTLVPNSGVLTSLAVTVGTDWSILTNEHQVIGKEMFLHLWLERTGVAVTQTGAGNIAGDPVVATINDAAKRPVFDCFGNFRASVTDGAFQITASDGVIKIASMHTGATIATNATIQIYQSFPIP